MAVRAKTLRAVAVPSPAAGAPSAAGVPDAALGRPAGGGRWRGHLGSLAFLVPAAIFLGFIVLYPLAATAVRSLFDQSGANFIGGANYKTIFSTSDILVSLRNNVIWVIVFPFTVTFLGLVFAVLTERIRWSTAFKTIVFMPIVFSLTASALIWRAVFDLDPHVGMVNATIQAVSNVFNPPGLYAGALSSGRTVASLARTGLEAGPNNSLLSTGTVSPGQAVQLGVTGVSPDILTMLGAQRAAIPSTASGAVTGLVWRDFSPSHPLAKGGVFADEDGLPGVTLSLIRADGSSAATTTSAGNGTFRFDNVSGGTYRVSLDSKNFQSGFTGIFFLGSQSITPTSGLDKTAQAILSIPLVDIAMIIAMLWIWAGFAMVAIGAGLASLNREVLEAARIDGATEWQTLRRVTVPMLSPVLVVVFVTMLINVLKIFDIILNMPPGSSQGAASTLALDMYNFGFTGTGDQGLASAIAVILFVLVIPAMLFNLRRIRG
ncbi:MAG: ABC transporter permease subunit [Candidatus Dormibacteraeota bacterium]|nr:ABC transporter permease subunit [Candidatus Dormibacteraeota bacterium]MBV9525501.1 ABC transporter permease subunit [Candidatus Dormibacteraeota bacterium]